MEFVTSSQDPRGGRIETFVKDGGDIVCESLLVISVLGNSRMFVKREDGDVERAR